MKRLLIAVASLVALASAGAAGVRAATPTPAPELGATIQSRVYIDQGGQMLLWNRSTIPTTFTFEIADEGWNVQPRRVVLAPDQHSAVEVTGNGGDGATIGVRVASVDPAAPGEQRGELLLPSRVFYHAPFDLGRLLATLLPLLALVALVAWLVWRFKPWTIRLTRAA